MYPIHLAVLEGDEHHGGVVPAPRAEEEPRRVDRQRRRERVHRRVERDPTAVDQHDLMVHLCFFLTPG